MHKREEEKLQIVDRKCQREQARAKELAQQEINTAQQAPRRDRGHQRCNGEEVQVGKAAYSPSINRDAHARAPRFTMSVPQDPNCMQEPMWRSWALPTQVAMLSFQRSGFMAQPQSYATYFASFLATRYFPRMSSTSPLPNPTNSLALLNDGIFQSSIPTNFHFFQNSKNTMSFPQAHTQQFLLHQHQTI